MCVCACVTVCVSRCVCLSQRDCVQVYVCVCACVLFCVCVHVCVSTNVCVHVCVFVFTVCVCVALFARNVKVLGFSVLDDFYSLHMSFAQTCHMSYTIDYLSGGGYQSHSVTLTCVDRDSYQSRLGLTTL